MYMWVYEGINSKERIKQAKSEGALENKYIDMRINKY